MLKKPYEQTIFARVIPDLNKVLDAFLYIYLVCVFVLSLNGKVEIKKYSNAVALIYMALLGIYVITSDWKGLINRFTAMFGLFTLYCFLTILWSADKAISIERSMTLLKNLIVWGMASFYVIREKKTSLFIQAFYIGCLACVGYVLVTYGPATYIKGMIAGQRMGWEFTNQNALGSVEMYAALVGLYYTFYEKRWWNIFPSLLSIVLAIGTGSRVAILLFVAGLLALFFFYQTGIKRLYCMLGFVALSGIGFALLHLPMFSNMLVRIENMFSQLLGKSSSDGSTRVRMEMIRLGIEQFKQTPILGLGIGTSGLIYEGSYLHNNYVELLACSGIIGFVIYYAMHVYLFIKSIKPAWKGNRYAALVICLVFAALAHDIASVQYYEKITIITLALSFVLLQNIEEKDTK